MFLHIEFEQEHKIVEAIINLEQNSEALEQLICRGYIKQKKINSQIDTLAKARMYMYSQACVKNDNIPPTKGAFQEHVRRAAHQYLQYKTACEARIDVRDPTKYGWCVIQNELVLETTKDKMAPDSVVQLISCNCKKGCKKGCKCKKSEKPCAEFCGCTSDAADDCQNTDPPMSAACIVDMEEEDDG